ncbi:hypothetical protein B0H17DRAFT_1144265 [Mycena rosella]|uniref:Uncharacterized protein n=1 Tax=Mycena rosella TaxID=1033263 RepID=A0AAD7CT93_MYCRO|nr:hypothetical protein B0H17DRAFT_1144265 [Mycena rosella]
MGRKKKSCARCNRTLTVQSRVYELNRKSTLLCPLGCEKVWLQDTDHTIVARHVEQHTEIVFRAHSLTKFTVALVNPAETSYEDLVTQIDLGGRPPQRVPMNIPMHLNHRVQHWGMLDRLMCYLYPLHHSPVPGFSQQDFLPGSMSELRYATQDVDEVGFASPPRTPHAPSPAPVEETLYSMDSRDDDFFGSSPTLDRTDCDPLEKQCEGEQPLAHAEGSPVAETAIDLQASAPHALLVSLHR